jgi:mannose-6-phosphate isomerase-like protein (cupin superfamily)
MADFETLHIEDAPLVIAPDGGEVRVLLSLPGGSMATFELEPGRTSIAVTHRTVEEVWYCVAGRGEFWRKQGMSEEVVALQPGVCLTVPLGTHFQFRSQGPDRLQCVAVTMPPWPGETEAYAVEGAWEPNLG